MPLVVHVNDNERALFFRELNDFIPDTIYDAHAHLWAKEHIPPTSGPGWTKLEEDPVDLTAYRKRMAELMPGKTVEGGMFLPGAVGSGLDQIAPQNEFMGRLVAQEPQSGFAMMISPTMEADYVREMVQKWGYKGLKCYHLQSARRPTMDSEIPEYLPESHIEVAHEFGLWVTLHMVKARAVADPGNQYWIRRYCENYPNMQMVLAHSARGFNAYHTIEGLHTLKDLPNLWCDMSAIADGGACEEIIALLGHDRLMYGSDWPVSHMRGRCVSIGDGFLWLYDDNFDWSKETLVPGGPVFIGLESLRVLKNACRHQRLNDRQVEDVFRNNARRVLGLI